MKKISILLAFILCWLWGGGTPSKAFYVQQSVELSSPYYSPYPPILGPAIDILPKGFVTVNVGEETFYYCNGIFYQKVMRDQKYVVTPPPIGAVVFDLPKDYQYLYINGTSFYEYKGVYYKRVLDGYKVIYPPA